MYRELCERANAAPGSDAADLVLRRFRQREMIRIAYRDTAGLAEPVEVSRELSALAEACVRFSVVREQSGSSAPEGGSLETLHAVALGKLGSRQMHYASDLDLIFVYDPASESMIPERRAEVQRIQDQRAERIEDLLWNLIPEAGHLRDQVGQIDVANGARKSHPLTLSQLLVGYHAVKAAMAARVY